MLNVFVDFIIFSEKQNKKTTKYEKAKDTFSSILEYCNYVHSIWIVIIKRGICPANTLNPTQALDFNRFRYHTAFEQKKWLDGMNLLAQPVNNNT